MTKQANVYTTGKPSAALLMTAVMASQATRTGADFENISEDSGVIDAKRLEHDVIEFGINPDGLSNDTTLNVTPMGGKPFNVDLKPGARVDHQITQAMQKAAAAGNELLKGLQL